MNKNYLLLTQLNNSKDLNELTEYEIEELSNLIISSVNLKQLRLSVDNACKILSGVGEPCFGADLKFIALDNQARLTLIYKLLDGYSYLESSIKNLKRNKHNCRENFDFIYSFVSNTIDLLKTVKDYEIFRFNEKNENIKYLNSNKINLITDSEE